MTNEFQLPRITARINGKVLIEHWDKIPMVQQSDAALSSIIKNRLPNYIENAKICIHKGYSQKYRMAAAHEWLKRHADKHLHEADAPHWKKSGDSTARNMVAEVEGTNMERIFLIIREGELLFRWRRTKQPAELHEDWSLAGWVTGFADENRPDLSDEKIAFFQLLAAREILRRYPPAIYAEDAAANGESISSSNLRLDDAYEEALRLVAAADAK